MPLFSQVPSKSEVQGGAHPTPMRPAQSKLSDAERAALRSRVSNQVLQAFLEKPYRWTPEALANFARAPEGTEFYAIANDEGEAYAFCSSDKSHAMIHNNFGQEAGHEAIAREIGLYQGDATGRTQRNGRVVGFSVKKIGAKIELARINSFFNSQLGNSRRIPDELVERFKEELIGSEADWLAEETFEKQTFAKLAEDLPPAFKVPAIALFDLSSQVIWLAPELWPADIFSKLKQAKTELRKEWRDCLASGYQPKPSDQEALKELRFQVGTAAQHVCKIDQVYIGLQKNITMLLEADQLCLNSDVPPGEAELAMYLLEPKSEFIEFKNIPQLASFFEFIYETGAPTDETQVIERFLTSRSILAKNLPGPLKGPCEAILTICKTAWIQDYVGMKRSDEEALFEQREEFLKAMQESHVQPRTLSEQDKILIEEIKRIFRSTCERLFPDGRVFSLWVPVSFLDQDLKGIFKLERADFSPDQADLACANLLSFNGWLATSGSGTAEESMLQKQLACVAFALNLAKGTRIDLDCRLTADDLLNGSNDSLRTTISELLNATSQLASGHTTQKIGDLLGAIIKAQECLKQLEKNGYAFNFKENLAINAAKGRYNKTLSDEFYRPQIIFTNTFPESVKKLIPDEQSDEFKAIFAINPSIVPASYAEVDQAVTDFYNWVGHNWSRAAELWRLTSSIYRQLTAARYILANDPTKSFAPEPLRGFTLFERLGNTLLQFDTWLY